MLVWGALWLLAHFALQLGLVSPQGTAMAAAVFLLLAARARWFAGKHWRASLSHTIAFCVPIYTLLLFTALFQPHPCETTDLAFKRSQVLEDLAECLYQNSITTGLGLITLTCAYRSSAPIAERTALATSTRTILLSQLTIGLAYAAVFHFVMME